jgi:hypothetical protein
VTYGDGRLDGAENQDGRRHVIEAATLSVSRLLLAFVLAERSPDEELAIWRALPFTIEAPEIVVDAVEPFVHHQTTPDKTLVPLLGTSRPVRKDTVAGAQFWSSSTFADPGQVLVSGVAGFQLAVPFIPLQTYLGAGATLRDPAGGHALVVDTGVFVPLWLTTDGLFSHHLNVTASWIFRSPLTVLTHLDYQVDAELGQVLVNLHVGLAELFPGARPGWYGALGLGYTFSAAGGGAF